MKNLRRAWGTGGVNLLLVLAKVSPNCIADDDRSLCRRCGAPAAY
jgi:hypothetical protein